MPELWTRLLDVLFPPRCAGCGRPGPWFCRRCAARCEPLTFADNAREHAALGPTTALTSSAGVFRFASPLREAIHDLKYKRHTVLADPLAALAVQCIGATRPAIDAIIPVPLHSHRQRERGFNQAELLARGIASRLDLPVVTVGLRRTRPTGRQVGLDRAGRRQNIDGAFHWQRGTPPSRILLIDDVVTTGATMEACAHALRAGGASEVHGWAICRDGV